MLSTQGDLAKLQVDCLQSCQECPAHNLCVSPNHTQGFLSVQNPLNARPGDLVLIDIPEQNYTRALIIFFGVLLAAALTGMGAGYILSNFVPASSTQTSLPGFFLGIGLAIIWLFRYFRKSSLKYLYPKIIDIVNKGDCHG